MHRQATPVRALITSIEQLRRARHVRYIKEPHPQGKRFTQEELRAAAPSFKNLHIGRTQRLPTRATILRIAEYLECTLAERNELLMIAEYLPDHVELREDEYRAAYEHARQVLHTLPLPAALVSRGWFEEEVNAAYEALYHDCLPTVWNGRHGAAVPWFFTSHGYTQTLHAPDQATWQANIHSVLRVFRYLHQCLHYEGWYQALLKEFQTLQGFKHAWKQVDQAPNTTPMGIIRMQKRTSSTVFREQQVILSVSTTVFPLVIMNVPLDQAAHHVYRTHGIAVSENRWERIVSSSSTSGTPSCTT
jgi:hypothetical protein